MRGAAIADKDAALRLNFTSGEQTCAGDGDEGIAGSDHFAGPAVEGTSVPRGHFRGHLWSVETEPLEQIIRRVDEWEATDQRVWEIFPLQSCPGPSGVNLLKVVAAVKLMREFEVMEDSKDGLGNFHGG